MVCITRKIERIVENLIIVKECPKDHKNKLTYIE